MCMCVFATQDNLSFDVHDVCLSGHLKAVDGEIVRRQLLELSKLNVSSAFYLAFFAQQQTMGQIDDMRWHK